MNLLGVLRNHFNPKEVSDLKDLKMEEITDSSRIYYSIRDNEIGYGFEFIIVRWVGQDGEKDLWDDPDIEVDFHGIAYYDGVRHLYMGKQETDTKGYLYYPCIKDCIKYFEVLLKLTRKYCPTFGDDYEYWSKV